MFIPQLNQFNQQVAWQTGQVIPPFRVVRILEQSPTEYPGGQAAFLLSELDIGLEPQAQRYRGLSLVITVPVSYGMWMFYNSTVASPADSFSQNLPVLLEIWQSWKVSDHVFRQRLQSALQSMRETHRILQEANQYTREVYDRANAAWSDYIRGKRTIVNPQTGEKQEVEAWKADDIVNGLNQKEGYNKWEVVPPEYLKKK
jgi:hypothetical protein